MAGNAKSNWDKNNSPADREAPVELAVLFLQTERIFFRFFKTLIRTLCRKDWFSMKRVIFLAAVTVLTFLVGTTPARVLQSVPKKNCTYPQQETYQEVVLAQGVLQSRQMREMYLTSPVITETLNVSVGDWVEKGQLIARIDTQTTKAVLSNAIQTQSSISSLSGDSADQLEKIISAYGFSGSSLSQALEEQQSTLSSVDSYETQVIPTQVRAPISGVVTQIGLAEGVLTQSSIPVVTIADTSSFLAVVQVGEEDIGKVSVGDAVLISGSGLGDQTYRGTVQKIYPAAEKETEESVPQVGVEILIEEADSLLKDGFTVEAQILSGEPENMTSLPYEAILQDENNREYVFIFQDGRAWRKNITTGREMLYTTEVFGLTGEEVVLLDPQGLTDGQRVLTSGS